MKKLVILGCGGFAREACLHTLDTFNNIEIVFYDDFPKTCHLEIIGKKFEIFSSFEELKKKGFSSFIIGVGIPDVKSVLVEKALKNGLHPHDSIVHPKAIIQDAKIGKGGVICPGVILTTNITIGDYVVLNLNSTVGHDSIVNDFTTCNPGSSISGMCILDQGIYFGVGAATKEGVSIAKNSIIGGQAFVTKSISKEGSTWIGIPAKELTR